MSKKYFPKPINSTDEFYKKLRREGKVRTLNSPEDLERQKRMNEGLEEAHRLYLSMSAGSIISARECYIGINDYIFY